MLNAQKNIELKALQVTWLDWHGCYGGNAIKKLIVPEAFAHPAKMSVKLCRRIFQFSRDQGMIRSGDHIVDPFGGIGTTALVGARLGYPVTLVELEEKFIDLAEQNLKKNLSSLKTPVRLIQGDSRKLVELTAGKPNVIVTSPPFGDPHKEGGGVAKSRVVKTKEGDKNLRDSVYCADKFSENNIGVLNEGDVSGVITSVPYSNISAGAGGLNTKPPKNGKGQSGRNADSASQNTDQRYGKTDAQIARCKECDIAAVLTSIPYEDSVNAGKSGIDWDKAGRPDRTTNRTTNYYPSNKDSEFKYGNAPEQIGALRGGNVDTVITSPPYEGTRIEGNGDEEASGLRNEDGSFVRGKEGWRKRKEISKRYGENNGQIGREKGETYWQAMKQVYSGCHQTLKPGGWMVIVVKDFVRKKQRVPLCDNTVKLLEHLGFTVKYRVRAWVIEPGMDDMFTGKNNGKQRKSFFRRLAEQKGSPKINWEEIIFAQK